jgi:hypothetical protein
MRAKLSDNEDWEVVTLINCSCQDSDNVLFGTIMIVDSQCSGANDVGDIAQGCAIGKAGTERHSMLGNLLYRHWHQ